MPLPEFLRTTTFRWTIVVSGALALGVLLMFAVVIWQTTAFLDANFDRLIVEAANMIAGGTPDQRERRLHDHLRTDLRRVKLGGLFASDGRRLAGNIESLPRGLVGGRFPHPASIVRIDAGGRETHRARAVAYDLPDGDVLVIGRDVREASEIREIIGRTLAFGLLPALALAVTAGACLSLRTQRRIAVVNQRIQQIIAGELHQRLPARGTQEPFDMLAATVNGMLDEMEALIQNLAGVGDDIAHDLRTPLTRVRISLERARSHAKTPSDFQLAADHAIAGVDHAIAIITALLRIREIEQTRRLTGFDDVRIGDLLREVCDLYEPIAEEKRIDLSVGVEREVTVRADRDLLFEAIANLVDNGVKFTPEGGRVELRLTRDDAGRDLVRVTDTGPGVPEAERDLIMRRFYRSDRSRSSNGLGLGLSLVAAIAKLHGYSLHIASGPGFTAEIRLSDATSSVHRTAGVAATASADAK